jgi:DNA polymerase-1
MRGVFWKAGQKRRNVLVNKQNYRHVLECVSSAPQVALDTETTGLRHQHGDKPFCLVLATDKEVFYIPLATSNGIEEKDILPLVGMEAALAGKIVFIHNAKFDMHMLAAIGFNIPASAKIHCTLVGARLCQSGLTSYSLDSCAEYFLGERKDSGVENYISEHSLYTFESLPGVSRRQKLMHFDRVPLEIMMPYAEQDAELCYRLGMKQLEIIEKKSAAIRESRPEAATLSTLLEHERELTRVVFEMEREGIQVDIDACMDAIAELEDADFRGKLEYENATGEPFKASGKAIIRHLEASGEDTSVFEKTKCGNICTDSKTLGKVDNKIAEYILRLKDTKSRLNFYNGFLHSADANGRIHTDFKQAGAKTGRFSSSSPNLQNMTRPEEGDEGHSPRKVIVPDSPDYCLFMPDYDQMEYRMLIDRAGEIALIEKVLSGMDVHTATSESTGIERHRAKQLNFALIYGAGPNLIAETLGITLYEAKVLIAGYFGDLPRVKAFIDAVKNVATVRGYTYNWAGRQNHYDTPESRQKIFASINHLIQGDCADVMRIALVRCFKHLRGTKSKMNLTIHDEIVFNLHKEELKLAPELLKIMEQVYPYKYLPLTVSPSFSWKNLAEKTKGYPQ